MLISFLSVTGVKIFISWIKKTWEERKHLQASVCFQQVTSEGSLLPHLLLPTWIVLLGLSATSFLVTLCCTWVPIHGSLALHRRLKIYMYIYQSKVLYSQPRSLSKNKRGNLSLMSHGHWEAGNISLAERLGKNSPGGFWVYLTNSFTTCQMKLLLFR